MKRRKNKSLRSWRQQLFRNTSASLKPCCKRMEMVLSLVKSWLTPTFLLQILWTGWSVNWRKLNWTLILIWKSITNLYWTNLELKSGLKSVHHRCRLKWFRWMFFKFLKFSVLLLANWWNKIIYLSWKSQPQNFFIWDFNNSVEKYVIKNVI